MSSTDQQQAAAAATSSSSSSTSAAAAASTSTSTSKHLSRIEQADALADKGDLSSAEKLYKEIFEGGNGGEEQVAQQQHDDGVSGGGLSAAEAAQQRSRDQETALIRLGAIYKANGDANALADLVTRSRTFMTSVAKAKTARLIRTLIDSFPPSARDLQIQVTLDNISWARSESRAFLRQSLEVKLIGLQLAAKQYRPAGLLIDELLKELKKLDDKMILTEVHLLESRCNHATKNFAKAKAALTSARTSAAAIYCPPLLQAQLDMQSGTLHAEDRDYKTAYSYFFETFEGFSGQDDARALPALKYMCLCKIMMSLPDDVAPIIALKAAQKYHGKELDAMQAVAKALKDRDLEQFEKVLKEHNEELHTDLLIRTHLALLYDTLLEQNLVRVIEPYSVIELAYIAKQVGQPLNGVESKLSQMILDRVFHGVLDQEKGQLIVYSEPKEDTTYSTTLETIKQVGQVVGSLYEKATKVA